MGRSLSPVFCKELANLNNDADSRKSAMKALESYVKEMDSKSIPLFLSQLSQIGETGSLSEEYTISLYEILARVHGVNIVPHIDNIMEVIVRTLASSGGSFPLQQSCSKVIPAIARYCISPIMAEVRKRHIIHSLCNPLCESLLASQESLSAGAALCLKALVGSDNWQFASDAMVNKMSLNVAVALDMKSNHTNPHMSLVMALAKKNSLIVEAYARLLIGSGLRILNAGARECNSQKRLCAIQMVSFLMKSLDPRSICSELDLIIEEMEKCDSDGMAFVKGAAYEALQIARRILSEKELKSEKDLTPKSKSNFVSQANTQWGNFAGFGNQSPESQTLDSLPKSDSPVRLSNSPTQVSSDLDDFGRTVKQRVQSFEDGVVNVSLKDGLFSELSRGNEDYTKSENSIQKVDNSGGNSSEEFVGFVQESPSNGSDSRSLTPSPRSQERDEDGGNSSEEFTAPVQESPSNGADSRSLTPSPKRSLSKFYIGNTHMFTPPKKPAHSRQNSSHSNSESSTEKQTGMFTSSPSSNCDWSQTGSNDFNGFPADPVGGLREKEAGNVYSGAEQIQVGSDSAPSMDVAAAAVGGSMHQLVTVEDKIINLRPDGRTPKRSFVVICSMLFLLLALITSLLWIDNHQEFGHAVPT